MGMCLTRLSTSLPPFQEEEFLPLFSPLPEEEGEIKRGRKRIEKDESTILPFLWRGRRIKGRDKKGPS